MPFLGYLLPGSGPLQCIQKVRSGSLRPLQCGQLIGRVSSSGSTAASSSLRFHVRCWDCVLAGSASAVAGCCVACATICCAFAYCLFFCTSTTTSLTDQSNAHALPAAIIPPIHAAHAPHVP